MIGEFMIVDPPIGFRLCCRENSSPGEDFFAAPEIPPIFQTSK